MRHAAGNYGPGLRAGADVYRRALADVIHASRNLSPAAKLPSRIRSPVNAEEGQERPDVGAGDARTVAGVQAERRRAGSRPSGSDVRADGQVHRLQEGA